MADTQVGGQTDLGAAPAAPANKAVGRGDPVWLSVEEQRSWRAYLVGTTLLMSRLDRELREGHGLSLPEYEVLVRLSEAPSRRMRMAVLADSMSHSRSRVTHTVTRLEHGGLVTRDACLDDGRGVEAVLTDRGLDTIVRAAPDHVRSVRAALVDRADAEDLAAVGRVFATVADALAADNPSAMIIRAD